ncbi:hypothetical protein P280DRAFT_536338 [Massarina eburnea CBS 473.64]|uniref:Uncharacterized protein n=1 Tax=Massarina eburnea CBS 473.64 TaxID=1395130 RepID=A0A6A6RIR0_9PLEO|nr:hypothetical protein P280DRAFT_536338 [Massarina eburnea CBS 473.64]
MAPGNRRANNATSSKQAVRWSEYETTFIIVYHTLILTYAIHNQKRISILSRVNMCGSFNTYFQAWNTDPLLKKMSAEQGGYMKRTFQEWDEHCKQVLPHTLQRLDQCVVEAEDESQEEWVPILTHGLLEAYRAMHLNGEQSTPETNEKLYQLLVSAFYPEVYDGENPLVTRKIYPSTDKDQAYHYNDSDRLRNTALMPPLGYGGDLRRLTDDRYREQVFQGMPELTGQERKAVEVNVRQFEEGNRQYNWENAQKDEVYEAEEAARKAGICAPAGKKVAPSMIWTFQGKPEVWSDDGYVTSEPPDG